MTKQFNITAIADNVTLGVNGPTLSNSGGSLQVTPHGGSPANILASDSWNGAWVSQNYVVGDMVSYNGSSYICKLNTVSNEIPTNTTYWDLLAQKGDTGATGSTGPQGPAGNDGAAGEPGPAGIDGKTVLNGTIAPTTEGVDGDFYIRTTTSEIYGPKTSGTWGSPTSLVGPAGDISWQGTWVSQNYLINEAVFYQGSSYVCKLNTISNEVPTNTTYWDLLAQKGDNGPAGADGPAGPAGPAGQTAPFYRSFLFFGA